MSTVNSLGPIRPSRLTKRGRQPLLSGADCAAIADVFDGTTGRIDALLREWVQRRPGVKRHSIIQAARRGGYRAARQRMGWSADEDAFLVDNGQRMRIGQLAAALGRSFNAVKLRRRRLGIGRCTGGARTLREHELLPRQEGNRNNGPEWAEHVAAGPAPMQQGLPSPALLARVSAVENPFLSLLGWRREDLIETT
jgi:hypothetical protein